MNLNLKKYQTELSEANKDYSHVRITFNTNVNDAQTSAGIVAKCTISHPAFTTRATIFERKGRYSVGGASIKSNNNKWFNIVLLKENFRNHIINEYRNFLAGNTASDPWYLKMLGTNEVNITKGFSNEELFVEDVKLDTNLSIGQKNARIIAKGIIETDIAILRGYSIFMSQFEKSLYGVAQAEDRAGKIPAYRLSKYFNAQLLSTVHECVTDWSFEKNVDQSIEDSEAFISIEDEEEENIPDIDEEELYQV